MEMNMQCGRRMAVVGMFDGVHVGHRAMLSSLCREAAERSLRPVVFTFENHPLALIAPARAPKLLTECGDKVALLQQIVDDVVVLPFNEQLRNTSAADFLLMLHRDYRVDAMMLGFNNRFGHDAPHDFAAYQALGRECGVEIVRAEEYRCDAGAVSSSEVRRCVAAGDVATAARLLGRPFSLVGAVGKGQQIGRTINFPTANIIPNPEILLPAEGVYVANVSTESAETTESAATLGTGSTESSKTTESTATRRTESAGRPVSAEHRAIVNIGHRPTVEGGKDAPLTIEAHILDYSGDLYGARLRLSFLARLRSERKFDSLEALRTQIEADRLAAIML
jgi:riboflavin kinase/FMN adenylyltransferase